VPLLQPSSYHLHSCQSADDWDNKRVDKSNTDEHNEIDVNNCFWHDNYDNCSDHVCHDSDHNDIRNCNWRDNFDDNRSIVFHADDR
jgi:hypothetical protein